jgi:CheY-like chemotaxis protein
MTTERKAITILIADDDADDRAFMKEALAECRVANKVEFVEDGEELLDYLRHRGRYANRDRSPRPGLILVDLNMPKKDGREAIAEIKADDDLRMIPIIVLTTSKADEDIYGTYDLGVNSFITKPVTFEGLVAVMKMLKQYWFEVVELPAERPTAWTARS